MSGKYEYRCRQCGAVARSDERANSLGQCVWCKEGEFKRVWGFSYKPPMVRDTHYNTAVGAVVSNDQQLKAEMKRASEEYTARTGIPMDLKPVDPREAHKVMGITAEGLEPTIKRLEREGRPVKLPKKVAADIGL